MSKTTFNNSEPNEQKIIAEKEISENKSEVLSLRNMIEKTNIKDFESLKDLALQIDSTFLSKIFEEIKKLEEKDIVSILSKLKTYSRLDYRNRKDLYPWVEIVFDRLYKELEVYLYKMNKIEKFREVNRFLENCMTKETLGTGNLGEFSEEVDYKNSKNEKSSKMQNDETKLKDNKILPESKQFESIESKKNEPYLFEKILNSLSFVMNFSKQKKHSDSKELENTILETEEEETTYLMPKEIIESKIGSKK